VFAARIHLDVSSYYLAAFITFNTSATFHHTGRAALTPLPSTNTMIYSYGNDASQNEALINDVDTLLAQMSSGATSSESVVIRCLERINDTDTDLSAWQTIDEKYSIAQARAADNRRNQSNVIGPLHGVPVGIKDVIDTVELTTQLGSSIYSGRFPEENAAVIDKLLAAGAIILGKTVTTELARHANRRFRHTACFIQRDLWTQTISRADFASRCFANIPNAGPIGSVRQLFSRCLHPS